jgi:hypothetical protein
MVHPDYIIVVVMVIILVTLICGCVRQERAEIEEDRKQYEIIMQRILPPKPVEVKGTISLDEFLALVNLEIHETNHPIDSVNYPLLSSRSISEPVKPDAPYQITKVILPMKNDHQKWN